MYVHKFNDDDDGEKCLGLITKGMCFR